jgi:hypothetical protein
MIIATICINTVQHINVRRLITPSGVSRGQQIQLRTEGRENGHLGVVAPWSGVLLNLQMGETRILIRLLLMYFPWNWEFGSAFSKLQNSGEGLNTPPLPTPLTTPERILLLT